MKKTFLILSLLCFGAAAAFGQSVGLRKPPGAVTDNTVPRFNGTGGVLMEKTEIAITDADGLSIPGPITQTGTTGWLGLLSLTTTERDALNGAAPIAGMVIYNETTGNVEGYDGSAWLDLGGSGSGDVANDAIWNAVGDLAVGTGANTAGILSKGTPLQVLRVNAAGTALEYATPAAASGDVATDTIWDVAGDLVYGLGADSAARLPKGTANQLLQMNAGATAPAWTSAIVANSLLLNPLALSGGTVLAEGRHYYEDDMADGLTLSITGTTEGTVTSLGFNCLAKTTMTIPSSQRLGGDGTAVTTLTFPIGDHKIVWERKNSILWLSDTSSSDQPVAFYGQFSATPDTPTLFATGDPTDGMLLQWSSDALNWTFPIVGPGYVGTGVPFLAGTPTTGTTMFSWEGTNFADGFELNLIAPTDNPLADINITFPASTGTLALTSHTHLLAAGATDVTATAAEVNLLDLAGLTIGWVLSADSASTASWKAPTGGGGAFSDVGDPIVPNTTTKDLVLGTNVTGETAKVEIGGDDDQRQLVLKANATQTNDVFQIYNSAGTVVAGIDKNGRLDIRDFIIQRTGSANMLRLYNGDTPVGAQEMHRNKFQGKNGSGTDKDMASMVVDIDTITAAAEDTSIQLQIARDGAFNVTGLEVDQFGTDIRRDIILTEQAALSSTPVATKGYVWVKNDTPSALMFTGDTGVALNLSAPVTFEYLYVNAGAMIPVATPTASAAAEVLNFTATGDDIKLDSMAFDPSVLEGAGFWVTFPEGWNLGTVQMKFHFTTDTGTTGTSTVTFEVDARAYPNSAIIDVALGGTPRSTTYTFSGDTLRDMQVTPKLGTALTITGAAAGTPVWFEVTRPTADTFNDDIHLLGVVIEYQKTVKTATAW